MKMLVHRRRADRPYCVPIDLWSWELRLDAATALMDLCLQEVRNLLSSSGSRGIAGAIRGAPRDAR